MLKAAGRQKTENILWWKIGTAGDSFGLKGIIAANFIYLFFLHLFYIFDETSALFPFVTTFLIFDMLPFFLRSICCSSPFVFAYRLITGLAFTFVVVSISLVYVNSS